MVEWLHKEEGICEGIFKSNFFRDEKNSDELSVYVKNPDLLECAEKCVEVFNSLTETDINEICKEIIKCAEHSGNTEEFELPEIDDPLEILNYCWFTSLYVNMLTEEDEISFVVDGEGEWGEIVGFFVKNNEVIYTGVRYVDYLKQGA